MRDVRHELEQRTERVLAFGEIPPQLPARASLAAARLQTLDVQTAVMEIHGLRNDSLTCSANRNDRRLDCHMIRPAHPILPAPRLV
jgi:hypothetical protein